MSLLEQARKNPQQGKKSLLDEAREGSQLKSALKPKSFAEKLPSWVLGLGQYGEDFIKGNAEDAGTQFDPEFPEHWKPEKIRRENRPERSNPTLGLEQHVKPGEEFGFNAGRYGPAIALALFGGGKGLKSLVEPYSNKSIGNAIVKDANQIQQSFTHRYKKALSEADQELAIANPKPEPKKHYEHDYHADIPLNTKETVIQPGQKIIGKENLEKLKRGSDFDTNVKIQDFLDNPTIDSAHWGKSAVNELLRDFRRIAKTRGLKTAEKEARKAAHKVKTQIQDYMDEQFKLIHPEHKKLYDQLTSEYVTEMVPYLQNSSIRAARIKPGNEGYIKPSRLPSKLYQEGGDPFLALMADRYPELKLNRFLSKPFTRKGIEKQVLEDL